MRDKIGGLFIILAFGTIMFIFLYALWVDMKEHSKPEVEKTAEKVIETPSQLLTAAQSAFASQKWLDARHTAERLLTHHPLATEANRAREIIAQVDWHIEQAEKARKQKLATALARMRKSHDEVDEVTWYFPNRGIAYETRSGKQDRFSVGDTDFSHLYLYIGTKRDSVWLWLRIYYADDDWLFIDKYKFKVDDNIYTLGHLDYEKIKSDHSGGRIWEWCDVQPKGYIGMIRAIIQSKKTILRYVGSQYSRDREITSDEKQMLQDALDTYIALGGNLDG